MHSIYGITILYIISNILPLISTAPITEKSANKSIYDFLIDHSTSKCSYLKTTKLLEPEPTFFSRCSNYALLKSFKSLTHRNSVRFTMPSLRVIIIYVCVIVWAIASKVINDTIIDDFAKSYNLSSTCQALSESKLNNDFKGAESVLGNFKKPKMCEFLCKELLDDSVIPICNLAAVSLSITGYIPIGPSKPQKSQGLQKDVLKMVQGKDDNVVRQDVSSVVKLDISEKTGIIENGQPVNDKNVENKIQLAKKPKVSQPAANSQESNSHVENGEKIPELHSNAQGPQAHMDNLVNAGDDTSVKANKALAADVGEKTEIQEENPVAVIPILKTHADKQDNQHGKQQEEVIQTSSDTQKSSVEQVQNDQKELIATTTEGTAAAGQDAKLMENDIGIDVRDPNQSNDLMNMEEDGDDDDTAQQEPQKPVDKVKPQAKPQETDEDVLNPQFNSNSDEEDSFFFIYFMMVCAVFILGYIGYHNKQKVLALVIEGRRGRRGSRRGRPNSANYHKLDSNLEEAVTSSCNKNTTNIIY